ncbi:MurR/RpiR family transcriptional regulator, partial [Clostridium perfringens]|nr:MurR/RpiR family transcriptional regulator [Clostridium perfringens]
MNQFISHFSNKINSLSHAEKYVFYYIDEDLERAKNMSLVKLAEANNVSTTTIIRMCSKLGLSGFSELKYILKNLDSSKDMYADSIDTLKISTFNTLDNLNIKDLERLSDEIKKCNKVIIVSVGLT